MPELKTLAERIDAKKQAKTVWDTDKKNWVYLNIPEENAIGDRHATLSNNGHEFPAGSSTLVPQEVYADMSERLKTYNRECVRQLQPKRDYKSEQQASMFGRSGGAVTAVDPASIG